MKKELSYQEALYRAAAHCSTGEKCRRDIADKLSKWGVSEHDTRRIIDFLVDEKYIDERRYCRSFVNDKIRFDGWGKIKIEYALRQKGIVASHISEVFDNIDITAYKTILKELLDKKRKSISGDDEQKTKVKLIRFAVSRGFEPQHIYDLLGKYSNEEISNCND